MVLGDVEYADDTMLMGEDEEVEEADNILEQTFRDWEQTSHPGKKEILRLRPGGGPGEEPRRKGEAAVVRHIGGWIQENASQKKDTEHRFSAAMVKIRKTSRAWNRGGDFGRGRGSRLTRTTRLKVMKAVVTPTLTTFGRSRTWIESQIKKLQRAQNYAVRRAMGVTIWDMREHHYSDDDLRKAAGWETVREALQKRTLIWLGHVARMPKERMVKQVLFGWIRWRTKKAQTARQQTSWIETILLEAKIPIIDWFRRAQDRSGTGWGALVEKTVPKRKLSEGDRQRLNLWRIGEELPMPIPKRLRITRRAWIPHDAYKGRPGREAEETPDPVTADPQGQALEPAVEPLRCPACEERCEER